MKKIMLFPLTMIVTITTLSAQLPPSAKPTAKSEIFADKLLGKQFRQQQLHAAPQRIVTDSITLTSKCPKKTPVNTSIKKRKTN